MKEQTRTSILSYSTTLNLIKTPGSVLKRYKEVQWFISWNEKEENDVHIFGDSEKLYLYYWKERTQITEKKNIYIYTTRK